MNDLKAQIKECTERAEESETKNLYLEAYSRRENLKFINITEDTSQENGREDTEEVLRSFMERELGYMNARNVEIQRVHRIGKITSNKTRPILARFLRNKDCQEILSLGHRLKDTNHKLSNLQRPAQGNHKPTKNSNGIFQDCQETWSSRIVQSIPAR